MTFYHCGWQCQFVSRSTVFIQSECLTVDCRDICVDTRWNLQSSATYWLFLWWHHEVSCEIFHVSIRIKCYLLLFGLLYEQVPTKLTAFPQSAQWLPFKNQHVSVAVFNILKKNLGLYLSFRIYTFTDYIFFLNNSRCSDCTLKKANATVTITVLEVPGSTE